MRNALLFLAILLTLILIVGGPEPLIEALTRLIVLAGMQILTHYLNESADRRQTLKQPKRHRLKKGSS